MAEAITVSGSAAIGVGTLDPLDRLRVSRRGQAAPASPIRMLAPLAARAISRGIHVYGLNIGQPDFETPPAVLQAIHQFPERTLAYAPSQGLPAAVRAWRRYYDNWGMSFSDDELIVTVGGSEAIMLAMMCVADPGDEVIVFDPSYTNYCGFAAAAGLTLRPIALAAEQAYHLPAPREIAAAVGPRTRAILICNPNNPTGSVYSADELRAVVAVAEQHDLFIISDEVYREFVFDGRQHTGMLTLPDAEQRTILVDSVSKRFNACGARIGCLATHHRGVLRAALHLAQARLSAPSVEQLAMVPLLEDAAAYTAPLAAAYQQRRDAAVAALSAIPGARFNTPEGAFYMILELPVDDAESFARWTLEEFADGGETVMVAPLRGFYVTPDQGMQAVRLAFVLAEEPLTRAITLLGRSLRGYPGRTAVSGRTAG